MLPPCLAERPPPLALSESTSRRRGAQLARAITPPRPARPSLCASPSSRADDRRDPGALLCLLSHYAFYLPSVVAKPYVSPRLSKYARAHPHPREIADGDPILLRATGTVCRPDCVARLSRQIYRLTRVSHVRVRL